MTIKIDSHSSWRALYICSAARCGSTFTDMFVGGHSQAVSLGEVNFLGKAIALQEACSCGLSVCECSVWNRVYGKLADRIGFDVRMRPYAFRLWDALAWNGIDKSRQTSAYTLMVYLRKVWLETRLLSGNLLPLLPSQREALVNKVILYDTVARQRCAKLLIDSSKNAREAVELHRLLPGNMKVVLLVRDGRGVFLSRRKSGISQRESLRGWMNYYRRSLPLLEKRINAEDLLILRYEDLAANPKEFGQTLCAFAGVEFEQNILELGASVRHIVNGNDTRFGADNGICLDERWKSELLGDDLDYFVKSGGEELNRCLGYR